MPLPSTAAAKYSAAPSHSGTVLDVKPRIQLSVSLTQVAVRIEYHPLERHLAIVRPVHMHTAAALATLESAMIEYERMAKTSAARAAAKKPSIAASMLAQELQDSSEVLDRLRQQKILQHR